MASPRVRSAIQTASRWSAEAKVKIVNWANTIKTSARRAADRESVQTNRTDDEVHGQWRTRPAVQKLIHIFTDPFKQPNPNANRSKAQRERTPSPGRRDHFERNEFTASSTHPPLIHPARSERQVESEEPESRPKSAELHRLTVPAAEDKQTNRVEPVQTADQQVRSSIESDGRKRSASSARNSNLTAMPSPNDRKPDTAVSARHSHLPAHPLARARTRSEPPESRFATVHSSSDRKPRHRTTLRHFETSTFLNAHHDQPKSSSTLALDEMRRSSADRPLIQHTAIWTHAVQPTRCSTGALQPVAHLTFSCLRQSVASLS